MLKGISVIIPAKGRVNYLEKLLEGLVEAKQYTSIPVEIIIVDDSHKEIQSGIKSLCEKFQAGYYYLEGSISEKRNHGTKIAKSSVVLFVDSDCEVHYNLLNEHLRCYNNEEIAGCLGITEFVGKKTWVWSVIEKMPFLRPFQWAETKDYVPWGPCTNISFRKEVIEKTNGFKSVLPPKEGGEDVDLGYRITISGYKICCNSNAKAFHTRETWAKWIQLIERTFRYGRAEYYLMKGHPKNIFLDVPKNTLIFFILMMLSIYKAPINNTLLPVIIPFLWLIITIFIQSSFALKYHLIKGNWKDIVPLFFALVLEWLFEMGTLIECIKKGDLKFLPYRFIYIEDQLLGRWYWGIVKVWGLIISLFILFTILAFVREIT
ncbi:glycosyltransferase [Dehalococcoidia bacterium]|nr:glycosyltransferase [Dehalococcoidia bacterium]